MASLKSVIRIFGCALTLFVLAVPVAHAGLVSGALPGLVSPSDTPSTCDTNVSQPFARWGDYANYVLVPGGSFEGELKGWAFNGGATVVKENEPYYVNTRSDRRSLYLPPGSAATTPPMCFAPGDWHMRFFVAGGSSGASLRVKVIVRSLCGLLSVLDGGSVAAGSTWAPSPRLSLLLTNVTGVLATDSVSFQLVPGSGSSVRVDDIYLDPWKDG